MNQSTFALVLTMSDAIGRPIMIASPVNAGLIAGSPVVVSNQMPYVAPVLRPSRSAIGSWLT